MTRSYTYDGDGLLRSRTQGTTTTSFRYDSSIAPAPLLAAGSERLVYGLGPLYQVHPNGSYDTLVRDGLGSVRLTVSQSGTLTAGFDYLAYGAPNAGSFGSSLLGFAGELQDPSGLIYLRARWYDPGTGRFLSRDLFGGFMEQPASLNAFTYARTAPTTLTDPSGACADSPPASSSATARAAISTAREFDVGMCLASLAATETLSDAALAMEVAGLTLQGQSVALFGVTFGAATPVSAFGFAAGAVMEIAGGLTEVFAIYVLLQGCVLQP